jgi:FkbH-like protein
MGTTSNLTRPSRVALSPSQQALLRKRVQGGLKTLHDREQGAQIPARTDAGPAPLSFAQQRLWFLHELEPESAAYNEATALRIKGHLDVAAFERALNEIHRRHRVLSARFPSIDGTPTQVDSANVVHCPVVDLQQTPPSEREKLASDAIAREAQKPFDLVHGPVARYTLFQLAPDEHIFLSVAHHIVTDGWSVSVFFRELEAFYHHLTRGVAVELPTLAIQYSDYAQWQRDALTDDALSDEIQYWKSKLAGAAEAIDLPTDRDEHPDSVPRGASVDIQLPRAIWDALAAECRARGITEFMALASAVAITLQRWTGQEDLVLGTVAAGRTRQEVENLIGCFMNFLPLRLRVPKSARAVEVIAEVKAAVLEAYAHQDCPFDKIVEAINPARGVHRNPLYNVGLLLQNFPDSVLKSDQLATEFVPIKSDARLLDLRFIAEPNAAGMRVSCEYDTSLFDKSTIETLLQAFESVLRRVVEVTDCQVAELELPQPLVVQAAAARARRQVDNIAVAATFTADPIQDALLYWLQQVDISAKVSFAPYNQVFQQLLDPTSVLNQNRGGLNVVLARTADWLTGNATLAQTAREFSSALGAAAARSAAPWLVCFCPSSIADADMNLAERDLISELQRISGVYVLTTEELLRWYPVENIFDTAADRLGSVPYTPEFFAALGTAIVRKFHALKRSPRKVIALDCDNTLWDGVCGEDGAHAIRLGPERKALQEFMRRQSEAGMLLCLCTKNNEADIEEAFTSRSDFPLRREHFVASKINWRRKSENLNALARELNVGLDSFIFVDDNPMECAEVEANCPGVLALRLPDDPEQIPAFLEHAWVFDHLKVTDEDKKRATSYRENREREELRAQCVTMAEFLEGLNLNIKIEPAQPTQLTRISQLTQRTNQFNFTTRRYSESEIQQFAANPAIKLFAVSVTDRFGDYGLVGVMLARVTVEAIDVDSFLLSCRVLGKGVEYRMLAHLGELARANKLARVDLHFRASAKNRPALDFVEKVAGPFRRTNGDGSVFSLPARFAATVRYEPEEAPPTPAVKGNGENKRAAESPSTFQNCRNIALHSHDVAWIVDQVDAWARANRGPVAPTGPYVPPRSNLEKELCRMWADLLGVEQIGIQDDFFAAGGSSLLAVRLFAQIEKMLGKALPLVTLFQSPTVEKLARAIEQRKEHAAATSIVPIQTAGSRPPLILVHGAGGGILWGYANLSAHLGQDQPVYAVEPRSVATNGQPLTVEEMARQYLRDLRAFQPTGPYFLGGYCFGGYVAYEIARLLAEDNETVGLLALIDSAAPNGCYDRIPWWRPLYYLRFVANTCSWLSDFMKLDAAVRREFVVRKFGVLKRKLFGNGNGAAKAVDINAYIDPSQFPEEELRLWQAHLNAGAAYRPQPFPGRITLLRTRTQSFFCSFDPQYGWGELARDGVEVRRVPGSHEAIFLEPHVRSLAAQVAACMRQAMVENK